jgi:hypothetical protein
MFERQWRHKHLPHKLKQFITKSVFHEIIKGVLHTEEGERHTSMRAQERINLTRRIDKQISSNRRKSGIIYSVNQQISKMKKVEVSIYISIIILGTNTLNSPSKRHRLTECTKKQDPTICCL